MCRYVRVESPIIRKTDGHTIFLSQGEWDSHGVGSVP